VIAGNNFEQKGHALRAWSFLRFSSSLEDFLSENVFGVPVVG
jgi:hypothetical protein